MSDRARIWIAIVVAWLAAGVAGWLLNDAFEPKCPTEDSCTADYRDGRWHIEEVEH